MKKFEVIELSIMPKGARFYFVGDRNKTVYEFLRTSTDNPYLAVIKNVHTDEVSQEQTYFRKNIGAVETQPRVKCVFLSLPQDRKKQ